MIWSLVLIVAMNVCGYFFFESYISDIAIDKGTALATTLAWSTATASIVLIVAYYDIWKEQHNKKILSETAQTIWKNLTEISHYHHSVITKYHTPLEIPDTDIMNMSSDLVQSIKKLQQMVFSMKLELELLEDLLGKRITNNMKNEFENFELPNTQSSLDIFDNIYSQYDTAYMPYECELKKLLIKIIKA
ncbi:hypothetical protein M5F00_11190 [Acinetobacter sp. ANC 4945]|uniref:Uncharacterized protein n=1 Tax=Acinetobacter amyesii TaxID=2942470 RepID=A0A1T1GPV4_9GAMM|nr:hypothetical protein [Acinetobacter amyesii]MCL6248422.1 hypothetical protein [Acinetobacter amyesii]OOV79634.1 hypothetical protein B1202_15865 [Acinetobacter amyesii]